LNSSLWKAIAENNYGMVKDIINAGADINCISDTSGYTPFFHSVRNGLYDLTKLFISLGCDVNELFVDNNSFFRSPVEEQSAIVIATLHNNYQIIKLIIDSGGDVNHANSEGVTALIVASTKGYNDILEYLLMNGANVNHKNKYNETALFAACVKNQIETIRILLNHNPDIEIKDIDGETCYNVLRRCNYADSNNLVYDYSLNKKYKENIFNLSPQTSEDYYKNGYNYQTLLKEYDRAIEAYMKATQLDPTNILAFNNLGLVYSLLSKYNDSLTVFELAVFVDPNFALTYYNMGIVYRKIENRTKCFEYLKKAADLGNKEALQILQKANLY
jgi:tetratricopeptide (TPR) repeat protein